MSASQRSASPTPSTTSHDQRQLPSLRFQHGDLIIKLGPSRKDWLLMHSSIIRATLPTLAPALGGGWERWEDIKHPVTGISQKVYSFGLKFIDNTCLLEGRDFVFPEDHDEIPEDFSASIYGGDGWPKLQGPSSYAGSFLGRAASAHKALFTILYGLPTSLHAITGIDWDRTCVSYLADDLDSVITLCAYAEYYGCLERVAPIILDLLLSLPYLWESIAEVPRTYVALSRKLRCSTMYFDAFRHLVVSAGTYIYDWECIGESLAISPTEAKDHFEPILAKQKEDIAKLKNDLMRLQLTEHWISYDRQPLCSLRPSSTL